MGDPLSLISTGLQLVSGIGGAIDKGNRESTAKEKEKQLREKQAQYEGDYRTKVGDLEKGYNDYLGGDEMNKYMTEIQDTYMKTITPKISQWAYERGMAGSSAEGEALVKAGGEASKASLMAKQQVADSLFKQKEAIAGKYKELYNMGMEIPKQEFSTALQSATGGKGWNDLFGDTGKSLANLAFYNSFNKALNPDTSPEKYGEVSAFGANDMSEIYDIGGGGSNGIGGNLNNKVLSVDPFAQVTE